MSINIEHFFVLFLSFSLLVGVVTAVWLAESSLTKDQVCTLGSDSMESQPWTDREFLSFTLAWGYLHINVQIFLAL